MRRLLALIALLGAAGPATAESDLVADWPTTGGDPGGARYSPLFDIHRSNVRNLEVVWTYRHGDSSGGGLWPDRALRATAFEATPIMVDGRLLFSTPFQRVIALDPESGAELWTFDPELDRSRRYPEGLVHRGVAYWRDSARSEGPCSRRVFLATLDARLFALDAATGRPCADFGRGGVVSLLEGIEPVVDPLEYGAIAPPAVVGDVLIVGSIVARELRRVMPPGDVRAFDARTGALRWTFHPSSAGAANVWSEIPVDSALGLVYLPVSGPGPEHFGGDRPGENLYANAVVALRAATGERVWHFQAVHHDLWRYDFPAPPVLVRSSYGTAATDALAVATRSGLLFLLDRVTGKPLFPVEERAVPASDVPGEQYWPTQPFPSRPEPLTRTELREGQLFARDPDHREACLEWLHELRYDGLFTPPSEQGSLVYPAAGDTASRSGMAYDPERGLLFVPVNNLAEVVSLRRLPDENFARTQGVVLGDAFGGLWWYLTGRGTGHRYSVHREPFAIDGVPCNAPPWGMLAAYNMKRGALEWRRAAATAEGVQGLPVHAPPLVTAGGLVFHGGGRDLRLRVHHSGDGEVLHTIDLPAGLHGGPITYKLRPDGKQYLVVAPGGHSAHGTQLGDHVIAFALGD